MELMIIMAICRYVCHSGDRKKVFGVFRGGFFMLE